MKIRLHILLRGDKCLYKINISFYNKENIHLMDIKELKDSQRNAILERALSTFYKKNVKVSCMK